MITEVRAKGTGSIVARAGKFHARWRISGQDVYGEARDTRDEAELDRIEKRPGDSSPLFSKRDLPTFQQFAAACMDPANEAYGWYGRDLADSTYNTNETILSTVILGTKLGKSKISRIEAKDVESWVRGINKTIYEYRGGVRYILRTVPASASWKRRCHAFVSKIFSIAVKEKFITINPAWRIELPKVAERENRVLTTGEASSLYEGVDRTASIMIVGADTGLRRSEIIRMMWTDIKPEGIYVVNNKNSKTKDIIPLTDEARAALMRQPKRSVFVFTTESGRPLGKRNVTRDVKLRLAKMGLPAETRLQDLRGTYLTLLIQAGVDIKTTQKLARHSDPKTTLRAYLRTTNDKKTEAIELMQKSKGAENKGSKQVSTSKSG